MFSKSSHLEKSEMERFEMNSLYIVHVFKLSNIKVIQDVMFNNGLIFVAYFLLKLI